MNNPSPKPVARRRSLFWRLWFRSLSVKRPQALLTLAALLVGAAVTAMLLNLQADVRRKMTSEFRAYGANAVVSPAAPGWDSSGNAALMDEEVLARLTSFRGRTNGLTFVPVLHAVARVKRLPLDARLPEFQNVVAVGADFAALRSLYPGWRLQGDGLGQKGVPAANCVVGSRVAARLRLGVGDKIQLDVSGADSPSLQSEGDTLRVAGVLSTGAAEDDQVFLPLSSLQRLAGLGHQISLVQLSIPGDGGEIERTLGGLSASLSGVEVRPIRQIVESQGKVLETIRWLLVSLTALILAIIALCVLATMTAIVFERRKDIAVMKALGATDSLVLRLFMSEGAGLGLAAGVVGFVAGAALARLLAQQLFSVSLRLSWWTLPPVCLLSVALATVATLFPVNIIRAVQPATALKGE
jgi:putative ABC transport system permease protein